MQRLQATAGNAAVAAMLGRPTAQAPHPVQRLSSGGSGGGCSCGCGSCTTKAVTEDVIAPNPRDEPGQAEEPVLAVARKLATPDPSATVVQSTPTSPGALPVARATDPAPPTEGEPVNLVGLTHNDGMDMAGKKLKRGPLTKLRSTPSTASEETVIARFPVNTRVFVDQRLGSWYHVVVEKTGQTGYMAVDLIETDLPDPNSEFHRIGDQETAFDIVNHRYKVGADAGFKNLRFYANGLVQVNSNRTPKRLGIYEPSDKEVEEIEKRALASEGRFVYAGAATKAYYQILLPSKDFADTLDVSSGSWVRDVGHKAKEWLAGAVKIVAFPAGLVVGALACLWDTIAGIVELAWGLLKGIVTGSLFSELGDMAEGLGKLITDPDTRQAALFALADWLEDRWENKNPAKRWYWRGWIIGYLATEVLLTFFSLGETLLAKAASKMKGLYDLFKGTAFGTKAVKAVEAVASATKNSRAAKAIKAAAGTVTASKPAKVIGAAVKVPLWAITLARTWAGKVLKIPAHVLQWISDVGVIALRKLSPKAQKALQKLGELGERGIRIIKDLFGCKSPCKFDPADLVALDRRLVRMAEADLDAAAEAAAAATRAEDRARRAAAKAEAEARKAASRAGTAKTAATKAEAAKDAAAKAQAAKDAATKARAAKDAAQEALAAKKAAWLATKERNILLGHLRGYRKRFASHGLNDIEKTELDAVISKLERHELSAPEARREYDALIAKARARRQRYEAATFLKDPEKHAVSGATSRKMEAIEAERLKLSEQRAKLAQQRDALARSLDVDPENIDEAVLETLRLHGKHREAKRLAELDEQYKKLGTRLIKQSEKLGVVATQDFAKSKDAIPLYEGPPGTPGTLDAVFYKPGPPVTLFVCEAKGGSSQLGTRMIGGTAYQQGHPEYLRWMLKNDEGFHKAAKERGLLKLIEKGEITTEYHLVQATGGTEVLVTQFDLRPRP